MPKYRIELDDGNGTFVELDIEAEDHVAAEDMALTQVKARPGADPDSVVIITVEPL